MTSKDSNPGGGGRHTNQDLDDAEKGLYDATQTYVEVPPLVHVDEKTLIHIETVLPPSASPVHEGITPFSSVPALSLSWPAGFKAADAKASKKSTKAKPKTSKFILVRLWFNTYRKFFTFITLLNLTGIILAALGMFPYAENHLGALVLGNLLCAILMRNELFLRILYTVSIYSLRSVCPVLERSTLITTKVTRR